jgi:hypothetical protein
MPFGRHRGKLLRDLPTEYLNWLVLECNDLRPRLRMAVQAELERRADNIGPAVWDTPMILKKIRKEAAARWASEPDILGAVNFVLDRIGQLTEGGG